MASSIVAQNIPEDDMQVIEIECDHNILMCAQCVNRSVNTGTIPICKLESESIEHENHEEDHGKSPLLDKIPNGESKIFNENTSNRYDILDNKDIKQEIDANTMHINSNNDNLNLIKNIEECLANQKAKIITLYEIQAEELLKKIEGKVKTLNINAVEIHKSENMPASGKSSKAKQKGTPKLVKTPKKSVTDDIDFLSKLSTIESKWKEMQEKIENTIQTKIQEVSDDLFGPERHIDSVMKYSYMNLDENKTKTPDNKSIFTPIEITKFNEEDIKAITTSRNSHTRSISNGSTIPNKPNTARNGHSRNISTNKSHTISKPNIPNIKKPVMVITPQVQNRTTNMKKEIVLKKEIIMKKEFEVKKEENRKKPIINSKKPLNLNVKINVKQEAIMHQNNNSLTNRSNNESKRNARARVNDSKASSNSHSKANGSVNMNTSNNHTGANVDISTNANTNTIANATTNATINVRANTNANANPSNTPANANNSIANRAKRSIRKPKCDCGCDNQDHHLVKIEPPTRKRMKF